ncbi:MAG: DNA repair protein RecO [Nevskia sp.]|nr:DNA repair protein RecO [Nevskia sp.]
MRQRIEFEPAWLLTQRPYRESSLLLEAFSPGHGRVGLVARGARGPRSKLRGVLQLFTPLLLSWTEAGELGTLTAAEAAGAAVPLAGERVFHGWYLNELLLRLTERHDAHPGLYRDYAAALARLPGADGEAALRIFEKRLLAETGYALPLPERLEPDRRYRFDLERGASPAGAADPDSYAAATLLGLRDERLETREALREARKLLRAALRRQLGGRELETPRLLRQLRARTPNPDD